jgi:hypothetical protein
MCSLPLQGKRSKLVFHTLEVCAQNVSERAREREGEKAREREREREREILEMASSLF